MSMFICGDDRYEDGGCKGSAWTAISDSYERPPYSHYVTLYCLACGTARREHLVMESVLTEKGEDA